MATFIITAVFILLVVTAMAVGVLLGRKPISGSCGGVGAALNDPDYICDLCGNDPKKCEEQSAAAASNAKSSQFYDASER
ncbi:(Na+)-NQR maturation NqrM [Spongiibacter sp. KMU-158]|uniref:(Na+)-NQR maturation NqrM n=1 Tax=Spongiibacter pelagi TaxID=2760804 RepID=A0A927C1P2_9GAMM|nr:(Na+)-NQR maturation NqrM [Spongiibacter pelagi]MBD2859104.1 (Na+)-NQR maturation NqrM [Spongiibacter pelagi]